MASGTPVAWGTVHGARVLKLQGSGDLLSDVHMHPQPSTPVLWGQDGDMGVLPNEDLMAPVSKFETCRLPGIFCRVDRTSVWLSPPL